MSNSINTLTSYMDFGKYYNVDEDKGTFSIENNIARVKSAVSVPVTFVTTVIDTFAGAGEGILGLPMALLREMGIIKDFARAVIDDSSKRISCSNYIIATPFRNLLQTINPKVLRWDNTSNEIPLKGIGLITQKVHNAVRDLTSTKSSLYRHTISRLVYLLAPIAYTIARIADGIIGLVAAPFAVLFSILFCGRWESLNNVAYRGLQAPGLIYDLYRCAIGFINPPSITVPFELLIK